MDVMRKGINWDLVPAGSYIINVFEQFFVLVLMMESALFLILKHIASFRVIRLSI